MLTIQTQVAITILHSIATSHELHSLGRLFSTNIVSELLEQLEMGKIIRLIPGKEKGKITSYELTRPSVNISLLDILEATGEHLNCNHPATEDFYLRYGNTAKKLGVVNHMTRLYLEEIKLNDL